MAQFWQNIRSCGNERSQGFTGTSGTEAEMSEYRFSAYVIRDRDGWAAFCPDYPDCRAHGATYDLALGGLRDLVRLYVEDGLGDDEAPPRRDGPSFTTIRL
jgi:predicted RNase H-like HicB family nuclease